MIESVSVLPRVGETPTRLPQSRASTVASSSWVASSLTLSFAHDEPLQKAMINGIGIVGFRDPYGIRPLVFGTRQKITTEGSFMDHVVSSESVVMDMLGFQLLRKYKPPV